jgi:exonuclease VII large subunit
MIAKIRENSLNAITLATANIGFRFQQVSDGARSAVTDFDEKVGSIQSFIKMASLQTGDKMRAQIDHDWASILESSKRSTSSAQSNTDRYFEGICEDTTRNIKRATQTVEELISHILSHGVEPTLKRGYALVTSDQKPISTSEEAQRHDQLKITFKDGSIITTPKKQ